MKLQALVLILLYLDTIEGVDIQVVHINRQWPDNYFIEYDTANQSVHFAAELIVNRSLLPSSYTFTFHYFETEFVSVYTYVRFAFNVMGCVNVMESVRLVLRSTEKLPNCQLLSCLRFLRGLRKSSLHVCKQSDVFASQFYFSA